jgi:putative nucleotidyltransferase with HDIG domain
MTINQACADALKQWFAAHVRGYRSDDPEIRKNLALKRVHSLRVCKESVYIGRQLGLEGDQLRLAEIIGLLHDIGRFEQYVRYRTFVDRKSENHAELGVNVLRKHRVLEPLGDAAQETIVRAIRYHNRAALPPDESADHLFFAKLIRDADKLDIFKVVTEHYYRTDGQRNEAVELDLPDDPYVSEEVCRALMEKKVVDSRWIKTLNDLKLLQVGWMFDINFQPTLRRIKERGYLELIRGVLPQSKRIDAIFDIVYKEV